MPRIPQVPDRTGVFACMAVGRVQISRIFPTISMLRHAQWRSEQREGFRMTEPEHDFRIRPGKPRSTRAPRPKAFVDQVLRAAHKAGHVSTRPSGKKRSHSNFGRGQNRFGRSRLFSSSRLMGRAIAVLRSIHHREQPPTRAIATTTSNRHPEPRSAFLVMAPVAGNRL